MRHCYEPKRGRAPFAFALHPRSRERRPLRSPAVPAVPTASQVIKPTEKFKFNFAWEVGDDTAPDTNPLYDRKYEAQLLFGRGFRAGIDSREQIQKQACGRSAGLASNASTP